MIIRKFALGLALGVSLVVAPPALAELANVYLKNGMRLRGDVTETATHVVVRNELGETRYEKAGVARIEWDSTSGRTPPAQRRLSVDEEYLERFKGLGASDLDGHFALAEWAREHKRWDLAVKQCKYILGLEPRHTNATLLLKLAEEERAKQSEPAGVNEAEDEPAEDGGDAGQLAPPALLSARDILRLKLGELPTSGRLEGLRVRFTRKSGQPDVEASLSAELAGRDDRSELEERFKKGEPLEKLQVLLAVSGLKYADRVELVGDPEPFATYKRRVLPLIVKGCARSGCHGGPDATVFRLPAGSRQSEGFVYTSFVLLDRLQSSHGPLIDRRDPSASVLLSYMLPTEEKGEKKLENTRPHPLIDGKRAIAPSLRNQKDKNYDVVLDWINSLRVPRPEYGLEYAFPDWVPPLPPEPALNATTQPTTQNAPRSAPAKTP